jgi:ParB family chromosome partitioning protein
MTKKALGKGLKAFLPEEYGILKEERFLDIAIDRLKPNPLQPRRRWDPESLEELAQSIRETGILQPIVVVPEEDNYTIIIGERRWRAAKKIGLQTIPVIIRNLTARNSAILRKMWPKKWAKTGRQSQTTSGFSSFPMRSKS